MYLEKCNSAQLKEVYDELGVTEESLQRDVQTLKEWLQQQSHLPNVIDENFLLLYLVRCKASLERAKRTLEMYYISKAHLPELFMGRDPTSAEYRNWNSKVGRFFVLPKLTPDGHRVIVGRIRENVSSTDLPNIEAFARIFVTGMTLANVMSGIHKKFISIIDCKNLTAPMVSILVPNIRRLYTLALEHSPMRVEAIYILNSSILFDPVLSLVKKVFKKEIQERLIVWKKSESDLAEVIPKECLPIEYGGTAGNCDELLERFREELETWKSWVDEENKFVADLSKVPEEQKKKLDMGDFGVEGSFRKLGVD